MQDQIIESLENPLLNHSYSLRVIPVGDDLIDLDKNVSDGLNLT